MTGLSSFANSRDDRSDGARSAHALPNTQTIYRWSSVVPSIIIAVLCLGAAAYGLAGRVPEETIRLVLGGVAGGVVLMLIAGFVGTRGGSRQVASEVRAIRALVQRSQAEVEQVAARLVRGERPAPVPLGPARVIDDDRFRPLAYDVEQARYAAEQALLRVADRVVGGRSDQRVEIFVNLARRMQSLVHREIELLDDLEAQVEDPDLLKGLFTVDHLATRMRRQSESLAVLGGSASRRQWTRQVSMHEVLRAAIAEVEQYSRVKVVPPVEGVLRGGAVADVIHLIAELVENATKFSAPRTAALLRAQMVSSGLAIEVEDRGLGMLPADQQRMNALLADPGRIDINELLRDGRIGLYVVSTLAQRHGIRVQLQNNIFGGTQAIVVLPNALLELPDNELPAAQFGGVDGGSAPDLAVVQTGAAQPAAALPQPLTTSQPLPQPLTAPQPLPQPQPLSTAQQQSLSGAVPERPALPRRQAQPNRTPQFHDPLPDEPNDDATARRAAPPADQMTGLMADFLKGVSRSEEEDSPARD